MLPKKALYCPVGEHALIGYLTKGEVCSFICRECQFMFTWDRNGKLRPPVKVDLTIDRKPRRYCGPDGCVCRD